MVIEFRDFESMSKFTFLELFYFKSTFYVSYVRENFLARLTIGIHTPHGDECYLVHLFQSLFLLLFTRQKNLDFTNAYT